MKKFIAKIVVCIKPNIKDIKGLTLEQAALNLVHVKNLKCRVGSFYTLNFEAENESEARNLVDKIAQEILSNEVIETYEIVSLEEVNGQN